MNKVLIMTKTRKVLKTVAHIVGAYRGPAACARRWDINTSAVSNWSKEGVPPGYHYRMALELEAAGYIVDGKALGWRQ